MFQTEVLEVRDRTDWWRPDIFDPAPVRWPAS
jgi:hypothetical protein